MANKIAILGSSGTIGTILSHELSECNIYPVTRKDCDLTNRFQTERFLREYKFDVLIHCAAAGGKQTLGQFIPDDLHSNLQIFQNLRSLSGLYDVLINVGTGAEFDISQNIKQAKENMLDERLPKDSYGLSKNLISRQCRDMSNAVTLRLFGCFHPHEPSYRLLKRFINTTSSHFILDKNRNFSWMSAIDFAAVIKQVVDDWKNYPLDMNCAYNVEMDLATLLMMYADIHNLNKKIEIVNPSGLDYTCDSELLYSSAKIKFGLEKSLKEYK